MSAAKVNPGAQWPVPCRSRKMLRRETPQGGRGGLRPTEEAPAAGAETVGQFRPAPRPAKETGGRIAGLRSGPKHDEAKS